MVHTEQVVTNPPSCWYAGWKKVRNDFNKFLATNLALTDQNGIPMKSIGYVEEHNVFIKINDLALSSW